MTQDIRWQQRFANYEKALTKLDKAVYLLKRKMEDMIFEDEEFELLKEGLIQRFEYTHELAWNVMKDYAEYQGNTEIRGSRDATREGFRMQLIDNADKWMDMLRSRNSTSHMYDEETAGEIHEKIVADYHRLFLDFRTKMESLKGKSNNFFEEDI